MAYKKASDIIQDSSSKRTVQIYNPADDVKRERDARVRLEDELNAKAISNANKLADIKARRARQDLLNLTDEEAQQQGKLLEKRNAQRLQSINEEYAKEIELSDALQKYEEQASLAGIKLTQKQKEKYIKDLEKLRVNEQSKNQKKFHEDEKKRQKELRAIDSKNAAQAYNESDTVSGKLSSLSTIFKNTLKDIKDVVTDDEKKQEAFTQFINNITAQFNSTISSYAQMQRTVNARLQGSSINRGGFTGIESSLSSAVGIQPYVKTQKLLENLTTLVDDGISYNVEQRAFLQTIKDDIAATFDATTESLRRIVRIQQSDSTAARLGLEASLNKYFNAMFENTEYLNSNFDAVSTNLLEASSQMTSEASVAFEYIVQKWLGSLSSVGLSDSAVSDIASAIGYLGSGNISALSSNESMQNLLVMAANQSGNINFSDLLVNGLTASETNELLESMVEYLKEIADTDNQVVKSQYAEIFGLSVSDLTAISNLTSSQIASIAKQSMTYSSAIDELRTQLSTLPERQNVSQQLDTLWSNLQYNLGTNIAKNPALYALWQVTSLIGGVTKGINIPTVGVLGNFIGTETTLDNLMKLGIVGVSSLGLIGDLINGVSSTFAPESMLSRLGITGSASRLVTRGTSALTSSRTSGLSTSQEIYVGNSSSEDLASGTLNSAMADIQEEVDLKTQEQTNYEELSYEYLNDTLDKKLDVLIALLGSSSRAGTSAISQYASSYSAGIDISSLSSLSATDKLWLSVGKSVATVSEADSSVTLLDSLISDIRDIKDNIQSGVRIIFDSSELEESIRNAIVTASML